MRHKYRTLEVVSLGHDVCGESSAADRKGVEEWVLALEVVVRLKWERLDSSGKAVGPRSEVEGAVERPTVPVGNDVMDAGVWGDLGVAGGGERDQHEG